MKAYSTPEILIQPIEPADILTTSPSNCFVDGLGYDNENKMDWWG